MDAGKVFDVGQSMKDAAWHQGVGGGVFLIATIVRINLDVAHGLKDGRYAGASQLGFSFSGSAVAQLSWPSHSIFRSIDS